MSENHQTPRRKYAEDHRQICTRDWGYRPARTRPQRLLRCSGDRRLGRGRALRRRERGPGRRDAGGHGVG
ncbi:hypothetical protein ACFPRL_11650 [Pseudoclavibacter helvolus]